MPITSDKLSPFPWKRYASDHLMAILLTGKESLLNLATIIPVKIRDQVEGMFWGIRVSHMPLHYVSDFDFQNIRISEDH